MVGGGASRAAERSKSSPSRTARRRDGLLVREQSGEGLDDVVHVFSAAVVTGEGPPPVLQLPDAVLDPNAA